MPPLKRWSSASLRCGPLRWKRWKKDDGSASLEFITAGMILLVPIVYLILAMASIQAGAFAVEGAARQAARVYVQAPDETAAQAMVARAVEVGLADYGLESADANVEITCETPAACLTRQSAVTVTVRLSVTLPLVPDVLSLQSAAAIPLQATATQTVSRFWGSE
ncbi:hypothetical protein [Glaciibacter superstes]|uniref:hypothetical protein n=1 Tax=Glaciibacter superstes TaxID=501023 RepID=UPI0003B46AFE|nr:hypothetical protein [Glaciibacter superstes]